MGLVKIGNPAFPTIADAALLDLEGNPEHDQGAFQNDPLRRATIKDQLTSPPGSIMEGLRVRVLKQPSCIGGLFGGMTNTDEVHTRTL